MKVIFTNLPNNQSKNVLLILVMMFTNRLTFKTEEFYLLRNETMTMVVSD